MAAATVGRGRAAAGIALPLLLSIALLAATRVAPIAALAAPSITRPDTIVTVTVAPGHPDLDRMAARVVAGLRSRGIAAMRGTRGDAASGSEQTTAAGATDRSEASTLWLHGQDDRPAIALRVCLPAPAGTSASGSRCGRGHPEPRAHDVPVLDLAERRAAHAVPGRRWSDDDERVVAAAVAIAIEGLLINRPGGRGTEAAHRAVEGSASR